MLNVLDAIEMTVVVDIAVEGHELSYGLGGSYAHTTHSLDGAWLIAAISSQLSIVEGGEVGRLTGLHIDECPSRARMAEDASVVAHYAEIARR